MADTWVIVGASRGIGLEFVRQILHKGFHVIAGVRSPATATQLLELRSQSSSADRCIIEQCDVTDNESIQVRLILSSARHPKQTRVQGVNVPS